MMLLFILKVYMCSFYPCVELFSPSYFGLPPMPIEGWFTSWWSIDVVSFTTKALEHTRLLSLSFRVLSSDALTMIVWGFYVIVTNYTYIFYCHQQEFNLSKKNTKPIKMERNKTQIQKLYTTERKWQSIFMIQSERWERWSIVKPTSTNAKLTQQHRKVENLTTTNTLNTFKDVNGLR